MYLVLDTSVLIDIERGVEATKQKLLKMRLEAPYALAVGSITYTEAFYGYLKTGKKEDEIIDALDKYALLNTTKNSSRIAAEITDFLYGSGKPIPTADIIIASIAIDSKAVLATKDAHFKGIQNLKVALM